MFDVYGKSFRCYIVRQSRRYNVYVGKSTQWIHSWMWIPLFYHSLMVTRFASVRLYVWRMEDSVKMVCMCWALLTFTWPSIQARSPAHTTAVLCEYTQDSMSLLSWLPELFPPLLTILSAILPMTHSPSAVAAEEAVCWADTDSVAPV